MSQATPEVASFVRNIPPPTKTAHEAMHAQVEPSVAPVAPSAPVQVVTPPPAPAPAPPPPPPVQTIAAPPPPVAPAPQIPQYDPRIMAALQQADAERQRLLEENQRMMQTMQEKQTEYEMAMQRQQLQDALAAESFADLGSVDPEDAKKIAAKVANATSAELARVRKELDQQRKAMVETSQQMQARMEQARIQQVNQRILQAHPDFFELQHTPAYNSFMSQRDGLSSQTRDQRAAQEFAAGNADYVIDILSQLKGAVPSVDQIASVAPIQTPNAAVTLSASQPAAPQYTLRDLNNMYQMRQITLEKYRELKKELDAAQNG